MADKIADEIFMNDHKIVASNLAAAIVQAKGQNEATPEAAAKLYFACLDALAKARPTSPKSAPLTTSSY